ncbi:hypothetical protein [Citreimonas salinaria]|uniref:hypothetical protein n=1 Tax=Citreimonas salinaria TaxID=321339 RepID=UPI00115F95C3|nr:hypothetical protein [Citreimonas salinaria]
MGRTDRRAEADRRGHILVEADGAVRFIYRNAKAHAWHLFQNLMRLCFPCEKTDAEKRTLAEGFKRGWESRELNFLASASTAELEAYKSHLSEAQGHCP